MLIAFSSWPSAEATALLLKRAKFAWSWQGHDRSGHNFHQPLPTRPATAAANLLHFLVKYSNRRAKFLADSLYAWHLWDAERSADKLYTSFQHENNRLSPNVPKQINQDILFKISFKDVWAQLLLLPFTLRETTLKLLTSSLWLSLHHGVFFSAAPFRKYEILKWMWANLVPLLSMTLSVCGRKQVVYDFSPRWKKN